MLNVNVPSFLFSSFFSLSFCSLLFSFPIPNMQNPSEEIYRYVELRVLSNWGHVEYTCLYRFRVHGKIVSTWDSLHATYTQHDSSFHCIRKYICNIAFLKKYNSDWWSDVSSGPVSLLLVLYFCLDCLLLKWQKSLFLCTLYRCSGWSVKYVSDNQNPPSESICEVLEM